MNKIMENKKIVISVLALSTACIGITVALVQIFGNNYIEVGISDTVFVISRDALMGMLVNLGTLASTLLLAAATAILILAYTDKKKISKAT